MQNRPMATLLLATALACVPGAFAAVTAEEAAQLKTVLTPFGAERAGNKDGSIPAWTGGYTKVAPGYRQGDPRPDPFDGEKPLYSVNAGNADKYADKLAEATLAMLKKYPGYRLDVYPTHRSAAAPQWVYDNTFRNATVVKTTQGGNAVEGGYGGLPFPIARDGYEHLWNHRLQWQGEVLERTFRVFVVTPDGKRTLATKSHETMTLGYYQKDGKAETFDGVYVKTRSETLEPASKAGESILILDTVDPGQRGAWQYLVGQRRVRKAPTIGYDTPDFVTSGVGMFDEAFMLLGPLDRHELKLIGKKEMLIPYNNNRAALSKADELLAPNFVNPDRVRWELHRVFVVEATLIPGKRHVVPKRRYYIDEDSRQIVMMDGWDAQGQLWRGGFTLTLLAPDIPALLTNTMWGTYNLQTGAYFLNCMFNELPSGYKLVARPKPSFYTSEDLAGGGR